MDERPGDDPAAPAWGDGIPLSAGGVLAGFSPFDDIPERVAIDLGDDLGDPAVAFRRTMGAFATGVTVLTTAIDDEPHGMTANAFMSVSLEPPLVLISLDRRGKLCKLLHEGMLFGVNVLAEHQAQLSDHFARRPVHVAPTFFTEHDTPLLTDALAHVVARVVRSYWGGDHSLFLGQVEYARHGEGTPLLFHGGTYERILTPPALLSALPSALLASLTTRGTSRSYGEGDVLMTRGEPATELLMIVDGSVLVERPGKRLELGPGTLVGEIEVLAPDTRCLATITALTPVECVALSGRALRDALEADPRAALALIELLASRFRDAA